MHGMKSKARSWLNDHTVPGMTFDAKVASILFAPKRGDYYLFLADTISGTRGRKSLIDIFSSDVERYSTSARGKLSRHWIKQFKSGGGSLQKTFAGTLPDEDVAVLDTLLRTGGEKALETALRDLAGNSDLIAKARNTVVITMLAAVVCLASAIGTVIIMPTYTVPKLLEAFSMLPFDHYPDSAKNLVYFSDFIDSYRGTIFMGFIAAVAAVLLSLSRVTGRVRYYFDKYGVVWGLYRDFQSIRFISTLAALVRENEKTAVNLKPALQMQLKGASRWKKYHLNKILSMVSRGNVGPEIFTTGIMDQTMEWYISDLVESRGISDALLFVKERLKERVLKKITIQSSILSWIILMFAIFVGVYLMGWHVTVIDDMKRALQLFLA